jgi:hypothetical protein
MQRLPRIARPVPVRNFRIVGNVDPAVTRLLTGSDVLVGRVYFTDRFREATVEVVNRQVGLEIRQMDNPVGQHGLLYILDRFIERCIRYFSKEVHNKFTLRFVKSGLLIRNPIQLQSTNITA